MSLQKLRWLLFEMSHPNWLRKAWPAVFELQKKNSLVVTFPAPQNFRIRSNHRFVFGGKSPRLKSCCEDSSWQGFRCPTLCSVASYSESPGLSPMTAISGDPVLSGRCRSNVKWCDEANSGKRLVRFRMSRRALSIVNSGCFRFPVACTTTSGHLYLGPLIP